MYAGSVGELSPAECVQLLHRSGIGRVALSIRALPAVVPVAFLFTDGHLYFRTVRHSKLDGAAPDAIAAFETGEFDTSGTGWSVLLQGRVGLVPEPSDLVGPRPGTEHRLFRMAPAVMTGQRLGLTLPESPADELAVPVPLLQPTPDR